MAAYPIRGALPIAIKAKEEGFKGFLPKQNVKEAAIVTGLDVYALRMFRRLSIS
jgi:magnesium chelatase family protein